MKHDNPHTLIVTTLKEEGYEPEREWELYHPPECKLETWQDDDGDPLHSYTYYTCGTQHEFDNLGLEAVNENIPDGEYRVVAWSHYDEWSGEYDGGVEILG